jgi:hypothetical protein
MRLWQLVGLTSLFNRKPPRSVATLQILETIDRNTRSTRGELQQTRLLLGIPAADTLPEVLDDLIVFGVTAVVGVFLPVFNVDIGDTTDKKFEFTLVENVHEIGGDELVEAGDEGLELLLDALLDPPLGDKPAGVSISVALRGRCYSLNVFVLVLVGNLNLLAAWFELNADGFTKSLVIRGKCQFESVCDVVVPVIRLVLIPVNVRISLTASIPSYDGNQRLHPPYPVEIPSS